MLRIHFSSDDVARVRLATTVDPMWETLLSLNKLLGSNRSILFEDWRRRALATVPASTRMLTALAPARGYSADFLTPVQGTRDLTTGIDTVLSTLRPRLAADVSRLADQQPLPAWTKALATGDVETLHHLGRALHAYHHTALAPWWPTIQSTVDTHLTGRARTLLEHGTERMLATLHPSIRWDPPVLHADFPYDRDIHLAGRGLLLVPAFFCTVKPVSIKEPELSPVLVYPIDHDLHWFARSQPGDRPLTALLGPTRAAVLAAVAGRMGYTTTELAHRVGISRPTASQHATVLREAGLLTTHRQGKAVLHVITPLGLALLNGAVQQV